MGRIKLTDAQINQIRFSSGTPIKDLAKKYGVNRRYVHKIRRERARVTAREFTLPITITKKGQLTNSEIKFILDSSSSPKIIAKLFNIKVALVNRVIRDHRNANRAQTNAPTIKKRELTEKDVQYILSSSLPLRTLAKGFQVSISSISRIKTGKRRKGDPWEDRKVNVVDHRKKLTDVQVDEIRKSRGSELSTEELSEKYGVSKNTIYGIRGYTKRISQKEKEENLSLHRMNYEAIKIHEANERRMNTEEENNG